MSVQAFIVINDQRYNLELGFDPDFMADNILVGMLMERKVPEREVLSLMQHVIRSGDIVVDVGANVGFHSLMMSHMVGLKGKVIAFEPSHQNYAHMMQNLHLNSRSNVRAYNFALSNKQGSSRFYESNEDTGQSALQPLAPAMASCYDVSTEVIDDFFLYSDVRLIKLDCEGSEANVLHGAEKMLRKGVPFVICELADQNLERFGSNQFKLRRFMATMGYDCWLLRPDGQLPIMVPTDTKLLNRTLNLNVLFATHRAVTALWPCVQVDQYL